MVKTTNQVALFPHGFVHTVCVDDDYILATRRLRLGCMPHDTPPAANSDNDAFGDTAPPVQPAQQPRPAFMGPRPAAPAQPSAKKGW